MISSSSLDIILAFIFLFYELYNIWAAIIIKWNRFLSVSLLVVVYFGCFSKGNSQSGKCIWSAMDGSNWYVSGGHRTTLEKYGIASEKTYRWERWTFWGL